MGLHKKEALHRKLRYSMIVLVLWTHFALLNWCSSRISSLFRAGWGRASKGKDRVIQRQNTQNKLQAEVKSRNNDSGNNNNNCVSSLAGYAFDEAI